MVKTVDDSFDFHPWDSEKEVGEFLFRLIKLHGCKSALELGVFRGLTCMKLIDAVDGKYTGVDNQDQRLPFVKEKFESMNSLFIQSDSYLALKAFVDKGRYYDFIFIDTYHTYQRVSHEFALAIKIINKNGIIALHDSILHEGVRIFIAELKSRQAELNIEVITFQTPDVDGRGGASGLSIVKFC